MSAINQALSELASNPSQSANSIERAHVEPVKSRPILPWVVGSFALSLAVGGWAVSYQAPVATSELTRAASEGSSPANPAPIRIPSPTTKILNTEQMSVRVSSAPTATPSVQVARTAVKQETPLSPSVQSSPSSQLLPQPQPEASSEPAALSSPEPENAQATEAAAVGEVTIEHVELTPAELSLNAQKKAKKALDNNDLKQALQLYSEALRYTPSDTKLRQTLSALYYGKGEIRKSYEVLQKGISRESDNLVLRLSLAKLLMKEQQHSTALTVLTPMPSHADVEYLSLRGALAQKNQQDDMALSSYVQLVALEPESGRWWLGLGIQQERQLAFAQAKQSYTKALQGLGVSTQSQQFIRDRLKLIDQLEEQKGEN